MMFKRDTSGISQQRDCEPIYVIIHDDPGSQRTIRPAARQQDPLDTVDLAQESHDGNENTPQYPGRVGDPRFATEDGPDYGHFGTTL
eukprot:9474618-Pyramimonas_sp.AAC.1